MITHFCMLTSLKTQAYCYCIHKTIATFGIQSGSTILTKHWGVKSVVEHFEGGLTRGYGNQCHYPNDTFHVCLRGMHDTVHDTSHRHTDILRDKIIRVFENICSLDNLSTIHFWFSPAYTWLCCFVFDIPCPCTHRRTAFMRLGTPWWLLLSCNLVLFQQCSELPLW